MKKRLYISVLGSLLCAVSLTLGGCSKEKTPGPEGENQLEGVGDRWVFLRIENCSSIRDEAVCVHFSNDYSHSDHYCYWNAQIAKKNWKIIDRNWFVSLWNTEFTQSGALNYHPLVREPKNDGGINFLFTGSSVFTWHQRVIISINDNDQENLIIKAKADLREEGLVETWIPWKNPGRKVQIEVVRAMAGHFDDYLGEVAVYVYLKIKDFKGDSSEGEQ